MNRKDAQSILNNLDMLKAFAEGKAIQARFRGSRDSWFAAHNPTFEHGIEYRIKPEPKVRYANFYPNEEQSIGCVWDTKERAMEVADADQKSYLVRITYIEDERPKLEVIDR